MVSSSSQDELSQSTKATYKLNSNVKRLEYFELAERDSVIILIQFPPCGMHGWCMLTDTSCSAVERGGGGGGVRGYTTPGPAAQRGPREP